MHLQISKRPHCCIVTLIAVCNFGGNTISLQFSFLTIPGHEATDPHDQRVGGAGQFAHHQSILSAAEPDSLSYLDRVSNCQVVFDCAHVL